MAKKAVRRPITLRQYMISGILALLLVWLVYLNVGIYRKERVAQAAAHDTAAQLASLQSRQNALQENMNELSTNRGQEAVLRETYGVALPGEGVIIVVPPTAPTSTPPESFLQQWFGWLKFW
jgi:cell division protein FtsB